VARREVPILAARNITKSFGGRTVLRDLDLDVFGGEVHGFVGQNGSGKSTFIKILSGFHAPDPGGLVSLRGREIDLPILPSQPRQLGISFVHQDLGLARSMTVMDNLRVGRYEAGLAWHIPWRRERRRVLEALARFDLRFGPDTLVSSLSQVELAMLAIVRALDELEVADNGLLVLDEPTAYLPRDGVDRLFDGIRRVAELGFGVLFVSHRLDEVQAVTNRVTVLRDGQRVLVADTCDLTEDALIESILGRQASALYPESVTRTHAKCLSVRMHGSPDLAELSLDVGAGETVGLTGLVGAGFERVPYLLFGAGSASAGNIEVNGVTSTLRSLTPRKAMRLGIALLPANRQTLGVVASATVSENLTLPTLRRFYKGGRLRRRLELRTAKDKLHEFDVRPPEPRRTIGTLSGGNQQKVQVAKWFQMQPSVLLLHEPTQGVDVGARAQIFARIHDAAVAGKAVLIASSEYADLANLCDRVFVFRDGQVVAELSGTNLTEQRLVEAAFRDQTAK
jgi:ribose transport system ATP-binding protein